eukprot:jgi/Psemu1/51132/gm1.51132_g
MPICNKKAPYALSKKFASKPPRKLTVKERQEPLESLSDSDDSLLSVETVAPDPPFAGLKELLKKPGLSWLVDNDAKTSLLATQQQLKHTKGKSKSTTKRYWTGDYMTEQLTAIVEAYKTYQSLVASNRSTRNKTPAIAMLDNLLSKFSVELEKERAKKEAVLHAEAKKKIAKIQKTDGVRLHEEIDFDRCLALHRSCPHCKHYNTMHLQSITEIHQYNKEVDDEYNKKIRRFKSLSAISDAADERKEETGTAVNGKMFLRYVEDKYSAGVNEQYLANPTASKEQILRDAHATTFDEVISDPILVGSAEAKKQFQEDMGPLETTSKDGKTIDQLRAEKRGIELDPSKDSRFYQNRLQLQEHPMDPTRFI